MSRIVIAEFMDERAVDQLRAKQDVLYDPKLVDDAVRLHAEAASADVIIVRNRTQVRGELLAALSKCRVVGRLGVGLDNIDLAACEARGIQVIPATGANALSVAEYVIATAMLLLRGAYQSTPDVVAGKWPRNALSSGREIGGKTLGLVGFGSIGQLAAKLAQGMGMRVIAHDAMMDKSSPAFAQAGVACVSLDELTASADVISLHVPLLASTRKLFDAKRIAAMKPGAVLINSARGGVVDETALADALKAGRLGAAALDVFEAEPVPADGVFTNCPNLLLTPHIAGVSGESNERVSLMIARRVLEELAR
ncbi:MAG: hydroxyacid dehydrogenase [Burkholderiales bacterium]